MRAAVLAAIVVVSATLLAGCAARHGQQATPSVRTPNVVALRPSSMERDWFAKLGLGRSAPTANSAHADKRVESIRRAVQKPGVQVVSLKVYSTPSLASPLAPALVLAVARPAYFLRHQLKPVIPLMTENRSGSASYLRVVDGRAKPVLEWYGTPHGGSLYVRSGLERCSPIVAMGWPINLPSCPSK